MTFDPAPPPQEAVQGNESTPSIYSVVESGKEYTQKLVKWMVALFYLTHVHHPDQKYLHTVVEGTYHTSYSVMKSLHTVNMQQHSNNNSVTTTTW